MLCLDDACGSFGAEVFHQSLGNLLGGGFLEGQAVCETSCEFRKTRKADDLLIGGIADVGPSEERQEMVRAKAVDMDVLDDNESFLVRGEVIGEEVGRVELVAIQEVLLPTLCDPLRSFLKLRVLGRASNCLQKGLDRLFQSFLGGGVG